MSIRTNYPENSFLDLINKQYNYYNLSKKFTVWSGLFTLASIVGQNAYVVFNGYTIYPNLFITLLSDNYKVTKEYHIFGISDVLNNFTQQNPLYIIHHNISKKNYKYIASKMYDIYKQVNYSIISNDIYNLSGTFKLIKEINNYFIFNRRIDNGYDEFNYNNISISSLCGSTPNDYYNSIIKDKTEFGYFSKAIPVYDTEKTKYRENTTGEKQITTKDIVEKGKELKSNIGIGRTQLSSKAIQRLTNWEDRREIINTDLNTVKGFYGNLTYIIIKVALLLMINENDGHISIIHAKHIDQAIKLITDMFNDFKTYLKVYDPEVNTENLSKNIEKIINILHNSGINGIKNRDLYRKIAHRCSKEDYDYIINTLHELDCIEKYITNNNSIIYRETPNLMNFDIDSVLK